MPHFSFLKPDKAIKLVYKTVIISKFTTLTPLVGDKQLF